MLRRLPLIVLVVLVLGGLIAYSQLRPEPNHVSGFIEADEVRLGSRVGGRVAKVHVAEGERVTAGQLLIELEPFDLVERELAAARTLAAAEAEFQRRSSGLRPEEVAQAKAKLDQLQARLDRLVAGPRGQEIEAARARLRAAEAQLKLSDQLYQRHATLVQTKAITPEEFERTSEALEAARATLTVRQNELELLELGTREEEKREAQAAVDEARHAWQMAVNGFRREEIQQAEATRDAARAELDAIRRQRQELSILSPLDGRVDSLDLQPGDMVASGAPVLSVIDEDHLWVRAYVPQNRVGLQVGDRLRVTVDSSEGRDFVGSIRFISRQAEFTPSNVQTPEERAKQVFRIKVTLDQSSGNIRPGMSADVWLNPVE